MEYKDKNTKIRTFKDLRAWQEGHALVLDIYRITKKFPKDELFALTSQMRRAAVSITSNIAEGFGRQSYKEKVQFFFIARGSAIELQNQLQVAKDVEYIVPDEFDRTDTKANTVIAILGGLIAASRTKQNES